MMVQVNQEGLKLNGTHQHIVWTDGVNIQVIHKSLRDFRPLRYSSRDAQAEGEHVNRGRDTPSFCTILQVLDISTLGDAADVNPVIKFLPHTCNALCGRNLIKVSVLPYRCSICPPLVTRQMSIL